MWTQTYPRDVLAHGLWAGFATSGTGKYEKAIEESEITIRLDPDQIYGYIGIANANLRLGRFPEVEKALARAAANHMDMSHSSFCMDRFYLAFFKNDQARMEREVAQSRGRLGVEDAISHSHALVLARAGRMQQAGETWQRAKELAKQTGKREAAGIYEAAAAVCDAVYGKAAEARKRAHAALELSKGRDVKYGAAFALAVAGDSAASQVLADDLKNAFPRIHRSSSATFQRSAPSSHSLMAAAPRHSKRCRSPILTNLARPESRSSATLEGSIQPTCEDRLTWEGSGQPKRQWNSKNSWITLESF
jgi:tetratricopeptide (TPR) repeat protein